MADITDDELQVFVIEGLSQNEIARRTGIPRSTVRRRLEKLHTHVMQTGESDAGIPMVDTGTQISETAIESNEDLRELFEWWRERKRALQTKDDIYQETQRQTYHVQKRYIEAIKRAADLERVSIMEIVNRAFAHYFNQKHN